MEKLNEEEVLALQEIMSKLLTEKQLEWIKKYAENQHPGSDSNKGTRFPVIYKVIDYDYIENYENGDTHYVITSEGETFITEYSDEAVAKVIKTLNNVIKSKNLLLNVITESELIKLQEYLDSNPVSMYKMPEDVKEILERSGICEITTRQYVVTEDEKAIFLTLEAAEAYLKYQSHNLSSKAYVYADYIGYANYGDIEPLCRAILKIGSVLNDVDPEKYDGTF